MIRVIIEVVPGGDETRTRRVADATIVCVGSYGSMGRGYRAAVAEDAGQQDETRAWEGVATLSHRPGKGCVALVAKALTKLVEQEQRAR